MRLGILFFGGWYLPFPIDLSGLPPTLVSFGGLLVFMAKVTFFFFLFAMVKAIVPRYRYDQLMRLGWKIFLPTSLVAVVLVSAYVVFQNAPARDQFNSFDTDKSGYLEAGELAAVTLPAGADADSDGRISFSEYRNPVAAGGQK